MTKQKPLTPLQAMTQLSKSGDIKAKDIQGQLTYINPATIRNWVFHDRPEAELGDLEELARELKDTGQQQPCIVRPTKGNSNYRYEIIAGERRWRAAQIAKIDLQVIIKEISDSEAAIIQSSENTCRKDLSDYAKGMSYIKLIKAGILSQSDLASKLNINKMQVSRLLSFSKIPEKIKSALSDLSKISARTSSQIVQIAAKGEAHQDALVEIAHLISSGKIGHNKISQMVDKNLFSHKAAIPAEKIYSEDKKHAFTWRTDSNHSFSIHFPKEIGEKLRANKTIIKDINEEISKCIDKLLNTV